MTEQEHAEAQEELDAVMKTTNKPIEIEPIDDRDTDVINHDWKFDRMIKVGVTFVYRYVCRKCGHTRTIGRNKCIDDIREKCIPIGTKPLSVESMASANQIDVNIDFDQKILRAWQSVTSRPMTSREVAFAKRLTVDADLEIDDMIAYAADRLSELNGERSVLLSLLSSCAAVIRTIEGENSDESDALNDLLGKIDRAIDPHKHGGALI